MIEVPPAFAAATLRREGESVRGWFDRLPVLTAELLTRWGCVQDGPVGHGGVALIVPVLRRGRPAVLKISPPHPGNVGEAPALRLLDGRSAVRLLDADEQQFGLLLERAGPGTLTDLRPAAAVIETAGALARRLAVESSSDAQLTALADTTDGWSDQLDQQVAALPGAVPADQLDRARATIAALAGDRTPTLLHGDLHAGNVLASARDDRSADGDRWLAIDPKGWTGTPAYDAFTVITAHRDELAADADLGRELDRRIARFARAASVDVDLCRVCVQARAVSSLLYQLLLPEGDWFDLELLRTAARIGA